VRRLGSSTLFLFLAASCRTPPEGGEKGGHLEAQWSGPARGRISGRAAAEWCSSRRRLEIRTVQGDTGIGLVIYPAETIVAARYRVLDPVKAESLPPAAGIALRWLTQSAVQGFRGDSGVIALERSPAGLLSGRISVGARSVLDTQKVSVTGTFQDLTVRPQPRGCVEPAKPPGTHAEPADTGVH
jgi:hypothetical protein